MTPRPSLPSLNAKRPLSAIFLGTLPNPSAAFQPPDLPDPPISPSSSSGLPSPPATNSTGSGSAGDAGSVRRPLDSHTLTHTLNMQNGSGSSSSGSQHQQRASGEDGGDDNDEDNTAKLSDDRRFLHKSPPPSENASALLRVKSLTQRNRMVLDKLASISSSSRLSTPSPTSALRQLRSPAPPSSSSSATSSRLSSISTRHKRPESVSNLSGSETERERIPESADSSDDQAASPPSTYTVPLRSEVSVRLRRISAPASPSKALARVAAGDRAASATPPSMTPRKRATMSESDGTVDVAAAALEAAANLRRSPTATWSTGRRRQPLPREFRDRRSLDVNATLGEPSTPHHASSHAGRSSPSPRSYMATVNDSPTSPHPPRTHRYSTVREMARRHQTRWLSQDMSAPPDDLPDETLGRRQTRRGGSSESPLNLGGRSVVGESLRAAGLAKKRDANEDVFGEESELQTARRQRLSGGLGARPSIAGSRRGEVRAGSTLHDAEPRTPAVTSQNSHRLLNTDAVFTSRPATSMAGYGEEPRTAPPLRTQRSAYPVHEREHQSTVSLDDIRPPSQTRNPIFSDRRHVPAVARRNTATPFNLSSSNGSTAEHNRLMLDSLGMFESQLSRLPSMGTTTTLTIPELFRSAQNIVHSANTLNTLLRSGTSHALEEQIEAEVGDAEEAMDPVDIWRTVGGDYRESLRVSDELVRTMTAFLLGIGKVLRDTANGVPLASNSRGSSVDGGPEARLSADLGQSGPGRNSADGIRLTNGRDSADARRSWQQPTPRERQEEREERAFRAPSRTEVFSTRPPSSFNHLRDHEFKMDAEHTPDLRRKLSKTSTTQRLIAAGESKPATSSNIIASNSQDTVHAHEPSPTPAAGRVVDRRRTLTPLSVPPPLSTLPSETLLSRAASASRSIRRNKVSSTSNATVRANSILPSLTTPNPTTAVTTTSASASPERRTVPLRGETAGSVSRASGNALAGLQQQYERDGRKRTLSSKDEDVLPSPVTVRSPMSGSETERDSRRNIGARVRMSLDGNGPHYDIRTAASDRKDRRRTVTDIFSRV